MVEELIERLKIRARAHSKAARMIADAKSVRNGGAPGDYVWPTPEQTVEGRAATLILSQQGEIERLREAIAAAKRVIEFGGERIGLNPLGTNKCEHDIFEWQDCIACYDESLLKALTGEARTTLTGEIVDGG